MHVMPEVGEVFPSTATADLMWKRLLVLVGLLGCLSVACLAQDKTTKLEDLAWDFDIMLMLCFITESLLRCSLNPTEQH